MFRSPSLRVLARLRIVAPLLTLAAAALAGQSPGAGEPPSQNRAFEGTVIDR